MTKPKRGRPERPADLPDHWDPDYQPTHAELDEPIAPPEGVTPDEALRAILTHEPDPEHVEYWSAHGGDDIL